MKDDLTLDYSTLLLKSGAFILDTNLSILEVKPSNRQFISLWCAWDQKLHKHSTEYGVPVNVK